MRKLFVFFTLALMAGAHVEANFMKIIGRKIHGQQGKFHHGGHGGGRHRSGTASASASASAASTGSSGHPEPQYMAAQQHPYYPPQPYYNSHPAHQYYGYQAPPVYRQPRHEHHSVGSSSAASAAAAAAGNSAASSSSSANGAGQHHGGSGGASAASASAATAANPTRHHYAPAPGPVHYPHGYPTYHKPTVYQVPPVDIGSKIAAASSAAAAASAAGSASGQFGANKHHAGAHIPAEYGTQAVYRDEAPVHYASGPRENVHFVKSGIYDTNGGINENSYYKKSAEEERNHEDGSEESDHYLSTKSHGKSGNENLRIRQGRDDFDQEIGPYSVKTKKRNNFNFVDYNKSKSETGTSVLQKDRHRAAYNKDTVKSREEIDSGATRYANGQFETSGLKTKSYVDDEDSEYYDSAGRHGHHYAPTSASAAAAAAAGNSASSSSSSAARGH